MKPLEPLLAALRQPPPVLVCVGTEALLVREAERLVREQLLDGPFARLNHAVFTAGEESAAGFVEAANTVPMMGARRLVELRQVQDSSASLLDSVLAYLQAPRSSCVLVLSGDRFPGASGGMDRGTRIRNAAKKIGLVLDLDGEGVDPVAFAQAHARQLGVQLPIDVARLIVEFGGGDLSVLSADVEKCASFVGPGGSVDRETVDAVCAYVAEANAWALTDAIVQHDADTALATLHRLLEDGEPSHKLLATVAWQLRQVLLVQDAARRGLSDRDAGIRMPPHKLRAVRALVDKRPQSPSGLLEELARVNRAMNSSRAGDRRALEGFVLRLVSA